MKVHTKFWPDQEIEVGPAEHTDLERWGLLVEAPQPAQDKATPERRSRLAKRDQNEQE